MSGSGNKFRTTQKEMSGSQNKYLGTQKEMSGSQNIYLGTPNKMSGSQKVFLGSRMFISTSYNRSYLKNSVLKVSRSDLMSLAVQFIARLFDKENYAASAATE